MPGVWSWRAGWKEMFVPATALISRTRPSCSAILRPSAFPSKRGHTLREGSTYNARLPNLRPSWKLYQPSRRPRSKPNPPRLSQVQPRRPRPPPEPLLPSRESPVSYDYPASEALNYLRMPPLNQQVRRDGIRYSRSHEIFSRVTNQRGPVHSPKPCCQAHSPLQRYG